MNQLEPALAVTVPAEPALAEPALTEIEPALAETEPAAAESSMEMKVFNLPTVITEPSGPIERDLSPDPALLADGCYDAACMTGSDEAEAVPAPAPVKRRPRATIEVPARLQTRPSNGDIAHAVVAVQDQIDGCGDLFGTRGTVPLKVVVAPSGAIKSVAVKQGSERFRSCVSDALRRARTPASQVGTTASFSILVR
jgi:hypothetical protein